jgi:hypothetical protein
MASKPILDWGDPVPDVAGLSPAPPPVPQTGFVENFSASHREMEIAGNTNAGSVNMGEAYAPLVDALERVGARQPNGGHFLNPGSLPDGETMAYGTSVPGRDQMRHMIFDEIKRRKTTDKGFLADVPDDPDTFDNKTLQRNSERLQQIRQTQAGATGMGQLGGFIGGVAGSFEDPVNLWTMPIGGGTRTVAGAIGRAAVENMLLEAVSQPQVRRNYEALGEHMTLGDSVRSVLFSGVAGGAFRAGGEAISHAGPAYDKFVSSVFDALPEKVRQRWAGAATVDDRLLVDTLRGTVPEEHWTPNLRSAVNVLERDAEIREASPFKPGPAGDNLHAESLGDSVQAVSHPVPLRAEALSSASPAATASRVARSVAAPDFERSWSAIIGNEHGTDRHGNFLTSPKGAIGPAQVMPGTAPYAARLAGLPWDEARYRTDRDYNVAIGRAYFDEQLRTFHDPEMAAAAYNAGPGSTAKGTGLRGALDRARKAGEPDNWRAYLPRETQQYVKDFRRRTGGEQPVSAPEPEIRTASAAPDNSGDIAETEALGLRRQTESDVTGRETGRETVEPATVPVLRRELSPDENSFVEAQVYLHRMLNEDDVPQEPAGRPSGVETGAEGVRVADGGEGTIAASGAPADIETFLTAKGSTYRVERDGTTTRDKAFRLEHGVAEQGPQPRSEATYYVAADEALKLAEFQAQGRPKAALRALDDGRIGIQYLAGKDKGKFEGRTVVAPQSRPAVGLTPIETWQNGSRVHFGNPIVEVRSPRLGRADDPIIFDRAALKPFDDPAGEGARIAADSIEHDLRAQIAANPALAAKSYLVDTVGVQSLNNILDDLDSEKAAVDALRGCL